MSPSDRSVSEVLQDIVRDIQDIVRSEVRLAKVEARAEITEGITRAKTIGLMLGIGATIGVFSVFFILLTSVYALSTVVPAWSAALIVAMALAIAACVLLISGLKRIKQVHPMLPKTVKSIKENIVWAKQQIK